MFNQSRIGTRYRSSHLCRRIPGQYLYLWTAGYPERQVTPWNASTVTCNVSSENARGRPATLPLLGSPESGQVSESGTSDQSATLHLDSGRPAKECNVAPFSLRRPDQSQVVDFETDEPRGVTSRSRHAASRGVTHDLGSVQALPWSCFITDDSVKAHGLGGGLGHWKPGLFPRPASKIFSIANSQNAWNTAALTRARARETSGGWWALETDVPSTAGRSQNFPHPQLAGRPCRLTSGGVGNAWRALIFLGRPLNSLSINVQKKGSWFAQKTQQKPTGFLGGVSC